MSSFDIPTKTPSFCSLSDGEGSPVDASNNNTNKDWEVDGDGFAFCHGMSPMEDAMQAGMSSVQPGLDGHLPLIHGAQDGLLLDLSSPDAYLDCSSPDFPDTDGNIGGPLFERRKRSRSNSSRHRFGEVVTELGPEEVRWFYKEDKKTWKHFLGHDSLKIERMFRKYCELNPRAAEPRLRTTSEGDEESGDDGTDSRGLNGAVPVERTNGVYEGRDSLETSTVFGDDRDPEGLEINVDPVCVRGGLYEVDIKKRECSPVYWKRKYHCYFDFVRF